jgi:hypothetical protein
MFFDVTNTDNAVEAKTMPRNTLPRNGGARGPSGPLWTAGGWCMCSLTMSGLSIKLPAATDMDR